MPVESSTNNKPQTVACVDTMMLTVVVGKEVRIGQLEDLVVQDFGPIVGIESTSLGEPAPSTRENRE